MTFFWQSLAAEQAPAWQCSVQRWPQDSVEGQLQAEDESGKRKNQAVGCPAGRKDLLLAYYPFTYRSAHACSFCRASSSLSRHWWHVTLHDDWPQRQLYEVDDTMRKGGVGGGDGIGANYAEQQYNERL